MSDRPVWLTFDCYGTLVDWEEGILGTVIPLFRSRGIDAPEVEVLVRYAELEAEAEAGGAGDAGDAGDAGAWRPYREVLQEVLRGLALTWDVPLEVSQEAALVESFPDWPVFPDTRDALRRLATTFRLAIVSNVDDDLFRGTERAIGVTFDEVITAEQARAYKPSLRPFELALEKLGCEKREVLHVAQSLYHDHEPARRMGLRSVRVNRPSRLEGRGLAPETDVVPEVEVADLASVAELLGV